MKQILIIEKEPLGPVGLWGEFGSADPLALAQKAFRYVPLGELRASTPAIGEYLVANKDVVQGNIASMEYTSVRRMLNEEGIDVTAMNKVAGRFGFLAENMGVGFVQGKKPEAQKRVGIVGICLPERLNLQTVLPLMVAQKLFEQKVLDKIYIAFPTAAYGIIGLPKYKQYEQLVSLASDMFADSMGEEVVLMPDHRLIGTRAAVGLIASPAISDRFAFHKYPFKNLFAYTEVAGYGADVTLPALAEQTGVIVVADFMQYESIHAGSKTTEVFGHDMSARVLPLLSPQTKEDKIVQVSHMNEEFLDDYPCPEGLPLFLAGLLSMSEDEARELYMDLINGGFFPREFRKRIIELQNKVATYPPLAERTVRFLEDKSLEKFKGIDELVSEEIRYRMRHNPRKVRSN